MITRIVKPTPDNIQLAAELLQNHEVVGMPTETVYGLAGGIFQEKALSKIFSTKERPTFDPLIVHVSWDLNKEKDFLKKLSDLQLINLSLLSTEDQTMATRLMQAYWPGPLTLIFPKSPLVPDLATSGLSTVAIRMPQHPVAQALIQAVGTPLAAPSANQFGRISPTTAEAVGRELGGRIELILDGGPCSVGVESTVLSLAGGSWTLLRPGGIPAAEIEQVLGRPLTKKSPSANLTSPGMLESHYAPRKKLYLLPGPLHLMSEEEKKSFYLSYKHLLRPSAILGLLICEGDPGEAEEMFSQFTHSKILAKSLSLHGDLQEAAKNLFAEMRSLDESAAEVIFAVPCAGPKGLGLAIADRLKRASSLL